MGGRIRLIAMLMVFGLVAGACGGDDTSNSPSDAGNQASQDDGSNDSDNGTNGSDDGSGGEGSDDGTSDDMNDGPPDLDPSAMPAAGEAVIEVDGQTFTIVADTMDYFLCDPSPEFTNVQSESPTQDLSVQADAQSGRGNARAIVEGSDVEYSSFFGPETSGGVSVDGQHILYEGRFSAVNPDNPAEFSDVGTGRVAVTCP